MEASNQTKSSYIRPNDIWNVAVYGPLMALGIYLNSDPDSNPVHTWCLNSVLAFSGLHHALVHHHATREVSELLKWGEAFTTKFRRFSGDNLSERLSESVNAGNEVSDLPTLTSSAEAINGWSGASFLFMLLRYVHRSTILPYGGAVASVACASVLSYPNIMDDRRSSNHPEQSYLIYNFGLLFLGLVLPGMILFGVNRSLEVSNSQHLKVYKEALNQIKDQGRNPGLRDFPEIMRNQLVERINGLKSPHDEHLLGIMITPLTTRWGLSQNGGPAASVSHQASERGSSADRQPEGPSI